MNTIRNNIYYIRQEIQKISQNYNRDYRKITLLAVSKNRSVNDIEYAIQSGQREFGENYAQEGVKKIKWFRNKLKNINLIWHFIGSLQSNKTDLIAKYFDWCHTIDRIKIIEKLNNQREKIKIPINVLIQINISNESTKSGIYFDQMFYFASLIKNYPYLNLRGIMAIPKLENNFHHQFKVFNQMYDLYKKLQMNYSSVDTLSLGTTEDFSVALASGSTLIRVGKAIFGTRN